MNKRNYQKELDKILEDINVRGKRPRLLLHSCCAPCSSYCLIYLAEYFDIVDFYYNPNISPKEEHDKRAEELERLIKELKGREKSNAPVSATHDNAGDADKAILDNQCSCETNCDDMTKGNHDNGLHNVEFVAGEYEPERFFGIARGLEDVPEGGERCFKCYRLRMEEAAKLAKELDCDYFTTTLSISPLKNAEKINEIGEELAGIYGVKHLPSDFKKRNGYKCSVELSSEYELYRQNYCGCVFSKRASATQHM